MKVKIIKSPKNSFNFKHADGGSVDADYEVEGNEVVQGTDTNLENQQDLASDMTKAIGASHEEGGVKGEGGERVFSDRLAITPRFHSTLSAKGFKFKQDSTYAEIAEKLGKKKGLYEEKSKSPNSTTNVTGKLMLDKIDSLIDSTFEDQENMKNYTKGVSKFAKGGRLPKYPTGGNPYDPFNEPDKYSEYENSNKSILSTDYTGNFEPRTTNVEPQVSTPTTSKFSKFVSKVGENPEQIANAAVYLNNRNNISKFKTNINRTTARPNYVSAPNFLNKNLADLDRTGRSLNIAIDRNSSNYQDSFSRRGSIASKIIEGKNNAYKNQANIDAEIGNTNAEISNRYNRDRAENINVDYIDKYQGENAKLTNENNATNSLLTGVMGNIASKRAYEVDKTKMAIAGMDAGRGTSYRSAKTLLEDPNIDSETKKYLQGVVDKYEGKFAMGGKIKMKKYC